MVKKVFPLLLSYVFVTTQCWAISGGPDYGGQGKVSPYGLYSGTIVGLTESNASTGGPAIPGDPLPNPSDNSSTTASNAIGLFNVLVPTTGIADGSFLLFADGAIYVGTINGTVDPDSDTLQALTQATDTVTVEESGTSTTVTEQAVGSLTAKVTGSKATSLVTARLVGTAVLDVEFGTVDATTLAPIVNRVITFAVNGFRQTTTTTTAAAAFTITNGGSGGGGGSSGASGIGD